MIVRLSAEAEQDLESIGDWIAQDSPQRAISFVQEMRDMCLGLAELAGRYPLVPRYEARGVRRRVHGDYLIFYRVKLDELVVLHVLHGAQDYLPILFPD